MDLSRLEGARVVVTGGAGFLGSHLCRRLLDLGAHVVAIDNLITGRLGNIETLFERSEFVYVNHDVTDFLHVAGDVDYILHFASPASPVDYLKLPIQTLKVGALGTHKALGLARAKDAIFMLASTSEVYGDPQVHPQPETYWGHVNPIGPRGVYDEAKRFAEAMTYAYHRAHDVDVRVVRIFNSILAGEKVLVDDGRSLHHVPVEQAAQLLGANRPLSGVRVPAFDDEARMRSAEAMALIEHPTTTDCFEVRTAYGRVLRVTGDHSVFVESEHGPAARPVRDLRVGDRIALAGRVAVPERDRRAVSLVEYWDRAGRSPWDLMVEHDSLSDVIQDRRHEIVSHLVDASRVGSRRSAWGYVTRWRRAARLPLEVLRALGIRTPDEALVRPRTTAKGGRVAATVPLNDEVLWFLGFFLAEGCWHRGAKSNVITMSSTEPHLLMRAKKVLERDFGVSAGMAAGSEARPPSVYAHGGLLLDLLADLGFGLEKRIPGWVLGLPLPRLKWFLEGFREGDGVHSGDKIEAGRHEFSTIHEDLKDDLVVALGRFGLCPSVGRYTTAFRKRTGGRRYPFWRVTVSRVEPFSPLEWDQGVLQTMNARRSGDLVWASVKSIDPIEPTVSVYDFSVPGLENFYAGTGVMAHNTFGPFMRKDDGRAVPTFISQALHGEPITVHGDGMQTRSLCYVDDLIEGILRLLASDHTDPVNIGNPHEVTVRELAELIREVAGSSSELVFTERPTDDPQVRQPDTAIAEEVLGWKAEIPLRDGLERTIDWFRTTE